MSSPATERSRSSLQYIQSAQKRWEAHRQRMHHEKAEREKKQKEDLIQCLDESGIQDESTCVGAKTGTDSSVAATSSSAVTLESRQKNKPTKNTIRKKSTETPIQENPFATLSLKVSSDSAAADDGAGLCSLLALALELELPGGGGSVGG